VEINKVAFARDASAHEHAHWTHLPEHAAITTPDFLAHLALAGMEGFQSGSIGDHAFWV
jgi:hypothetical protein